MTPFLPSQTESEARVWPMPDGFCPDRFGSAAQEGLPTNLAEWLGETRLERVVEDVVGAAMEPLRCSLTWGPLLAVPGTEALLKSLVLAYAKGVYASSEIELDRRVRELWAGAAAQPSAVALRRVRRELRSLLESALAAVVQAAWEASVPSSGAGRRPSCSRGGVRGWWPGRADGVPDFGAVSRERVGLAVQADRMELDEET